MKSLSDNGTAACDIFTHTINVFRISACVAIFAVWTLCSGQVRAQGASWIAGVVETTVYGVNVDDETVKSMLHWMPTKGGHPPLTPKQALEVAAESLQKDKELSGVKWQVKSITLQPVNAVLPSSPWIYVVEFSGFSESRKITPHPQIRCPITFDGKALAFERVEWPEERIREIFHD